jgi:hypothetical protein
MDDNFFYQNDPGSRQKFTEKKSNQIRRILQIFDLEK